MNVKFIFTVFGSYHRSAKSFRSALGKRLTVQRAPV